MLKRHEIEIFLRAGHPEMEVARLAGVSARSAPSHRGRGSGGSCQRLCGAGAEAHGKISGNWFSRS
jgi:hypothetical protein